jgi:predicted GTPase
MDLTVHINHSAEIHELINRFSSFHFLKNVILKEDETISWYMNNDYWNFNNTLIHQIQIMFIGKSGYGKSTTLNGIIGRNAFDTDDVKACTKDLYSANYRLNKHNNHFLALCDLPGIGESKLADTKYYEWYREMLMKSHCVVYVLRADQRDFALDEILFKEMFKNSIERKKVIIALNFADKVEPISRTATLSPVQIENLKKKVSTVMRLFDITDDRILYYSATDKLNMDGLVNKIANVVKKNL